MELTVKLNVRFAWWCKPFVWLIAWICAPFYLFGKRMPECVADWASDIIVNHGATVQVE